MDHFRADDLTIETSQAPGGPLVLTWRGRSNLRDPGKALRPFFDLAVTEAARTGHGIEMRFQHLDSFNSSTITALVRLVRTLHAARVGLVVQFDGRIRAQRLSFEALQPLETPGVVTRFVDVSARAGP